MYQFASLDYYKPMEHLEVDENTNVDVFEEIEENYPRSFEYARAQVNALDEVCSHTHIKGIHRNFERGVTSGLCCNH
jgi:hypothetical protein